MKNGPEVEKRVANKLIGEGLIIQDQIILYNGVGDFFLFRINCHTQEVKKVQKNFSIALRCTHDNQIEFAKGARTATVAFTAENSDFFFFFLHIAQIST